VRKPEKKDSDPKFFQSVWELHTKPSLSLDNAPGRTMLDDWLVKESANFEKLELACRATPWLLNDLTPKERLAFEYIVAVYRTHQANVPQAESPQSKVPTLLPPPTGTGSPE
jgi:hypothetical protein